LSSWTHIPTWNGNNIFDGWSNSGIVRVNNEQIKDNFKSFLESKGLSTTWTYQV
jgi:hypothetical protein